MFNHALELTRMAQRVGSLRRSARHSPRIVSPHCERISQSFDIRSVSPRLVADPGSNSVSAACGEHRGNGRDPSSSGGLPGLVGGDSHQNS
jgi:hypothetical protein